MRTKTKGPDALVTRERIKLPPALMNPGFCLFHSDRPATHNGTQCASCYQTVVKAVREGRAKWETLQRKGMIRQRQTIEDFWLAG